jgi:hypothetical protein
MATAVNKAYELRRYLGLTPTEAGQLLLGYSAETAHNLWSGWENGTEILSGTTERYLNLILILALFQDYRTPGADQALDRVLGLFRDNLLGTRSNELMQSSEEE